MKNRLVLGQFNSFLAIACVIALITIGAERRVVSDERPERTVHVNPSRPNASDRNPGTSDSPLKSIAGAVALANPGDVVLLHAGTYHAPVARNAAVVSIDKQGVEHAPITLRGADASQVILDATGASWGILLDSSAWWIIENVTVVGAQRGGIALRDSPDCIIRNCRIREVRDQRSVNHVAAAIYCVGGSHRAAIRQNRISNCGLGILVRDESGQPILAPVVERNLIRDIHWFDVQGNYHDKNADGVVFNNAMKGTIRENVIARCGDDGVDVYGSNDCLIVGNLTFNHGDGLSGSPANARGDGNGIKVSTGGGGGHVIRENAAINNERAGFDEDRSDPRAAGNRYVANIACGNGRNGAIIEVKGTSPTVMCTNAFFANNRENKNFSDLRVVRDTPYSGQSNYLGDNQLPSAESGTRPTPNHVPAQPELGIMLDSEWLISIDAIDPRGIAAFNEMFALVDELKQRAQPCDGK